MNNQTIEIPDPVMVWETEYDLPITNEPYGEYIVRAVVGDVVVFEQKYPEYNPFAGAGVDDMDDAKAKAANELGEKLKELLS